MIENNKSTEEQIKEWTQRKKEEMNTSARMFEGVLGNIKFAILVPLELNERRED